MPLAPGDILFVGWDADNDDISFITTVDLPEGEVIFFTDDEWDGAEFNGSEQYMEWTVPPGGVDAGTIVTIDMDTGADTATIDAGGNFDYLRGGYDIANRNEMFWAFQGTRDGNLAIPDNFIAVIANEADGSDNQTPNLDGTGLTEQNGAFIFDGDEDYMEWLGDDAAPSPIRRDDLIASILDQDNWVTADGGGNSNPNGDGFNLMDLSVVCFTRGVMIATPLGERPVETLAVGDLVETLDGGPQPIRWIGERRFGPMTLARRPKLRPIEIAKGALGPSSPSRSLMLSRQHRVLARSPVAARMFGTREVLIAAAHLLEIEGVETRRPRGGVSYFHILFDRHEVIFSNGAPTESLYLGANARAAMPEDALAEIAEIFPDAPREGSAGAPVRPFPDTGKRARALVARHVKNAKDLIACA